MKNFSIEEIEDIKTFEYCADYQILGLWSYVNAAYRDVYNSVWYIMEIAVNNHDTAQIKRCLTRAEQLEIVKSRISGTESAIIKHIGINRGINWLPQFKAFLQILEKINNL